MPAFLTDRQWLAVLLAVFMAVALSACGGGGGGTAPMPDPPPPPPTAEEMCTDAGNHWVDGACMTPGEYTVQMTLASIAAAATAADAQAAYDAVKDQVTATQGDALQMAVNARVEELATMARADSQRQALMDAAGMIDTSDLSTQALVNAARAAIADLRQAIADAVDVDDTSMYQTMLTNAVDAVDTAQGGIDTETRRMNQMTALSDASDDLQAALTALSGATPTQAQLDAANNALMALNDAITGGADLTDTEKAPYQHEADNAAAPIRTAQMAFDDAEDETAKMEAEAMAVTAAKLYAGIAVQDGAQATVAAGTALGAGERAAAYNDADVPSGNTPATPVDTRIMVGIGTATPVALSEDKGTTVAALHGWTGKRYHRTRPASEGMYEAMVYSNVEDPEEGDKFGQIGVTTAATGYEYGLTADGETPSGFTWVAANVASSSFDHDAGNKEFKLPSNAIRVMISGSYHGVSGTYYCTPAADNTCAVQVAARGFTLGGTANVGNAFATTGGTWTFKPSNPEARVRDSMDTNYASYGWWIHKTADDKTYTASAFVDDKGASLASGDIIDALNGTATYVGGAAGKYALSSSTGGINDAGHFTARATLEADFTNNTETSAITGIIDQFMGADGMSRDWSVKLNGSAIANDGTFSDDTNGTEWTIGGTAADDSGEWVGSLRETGDDGVPAVATGTFYTEYGSDGKMVGAFGANKQ